MHGDIKPENIFVSKENFFIGDLGSLRKVKDPADNIHKAGCCTWGYYGVNDHKARKLAYEDRREDDVIQIEKKRDVYAIGQIIKSVVQLEKDNFGDMIARTQAEDYRQRPTAEELAKAIKEEVELCIQKTCSSAEESDQNKRKKSIPIDN